jgi:SecD-like export protein
MPRAVCVVLFLFAAVLAGCATQTPTPTPEGFRLEPVRPARAAQLVASREQLQGRVDVMRPGTRVTVVDDALWVEMPLNEATPSFVQRLTSRGEVWLVPVPAAAPIPIAGQRLDLRPLIRNDGFAEASLGEADGRPTLQFVFNPEAAAVLGVHTSAHVGEVIAVVVDGIVVSAPIIREPIFGGEMVIEGPDRREDLAWIVEVLRHGVLEIELAGGPYEPD